MAGANAARPEHSIGDLPAHADAVLVEDGDHGPRHVVVPTIAPAELSALGFDEPTLEDHALTGRLLSVTVHDESIPLRLGSVFSLDGSGSAASMRILAVPEPLMRMDEPYVPLALAMEAAQRADAAAGPPQAQEHRSVPPPGRG